MGTLTPLLINLLHASLPTPEVPPVTTATLPVIAFARMTTMNLAVATLYVTYAPAARTAAVSSFPIKVSVARARGRRRQRDGDDGPGRLKTHNLCRGSRGGQTCNTKQGAGATNFFLFLLVWVAMAWRSGGKSNAELVANLKSEDLCPPLLPPQSPLSRLHPKVFHGLKRLSQGTDYWAPTQLVGSRLQCLRLTDDGTLPATPTRIPHRQ